MADLAAQQMSPLLRRKDVERETGLSRSAIYAQMAEGKFPRPYLIGSRAVAWREWEINAWKASRPLNL